MLAIKANFHRFQERRSWCWFRTKIMEIHHPCQKGTCHPRIRQRYLLAVDNGIETFAGRRLDTTSWRGDKYWLLTAASEPWVHFGLSDICRIYFRFLEKEVLDKLTKHSMYFSLYPFYGRQYYNNIIIALCERIINSRLTTLLTADSLHVSSQIIYIRSSSINSLFAISARLWLAFRRRGRLFLPGEASTASSTFWDSSASNDQPIRLYTNRFRVSWIRKIFPWIGCICSLSFVLCAAESIEFSALFHLGLNNFLQFLINLQGYSMTCSFFDL